MMVKGNIHAVASIHAVENNADVIDEMKYSGSHEI